MAEMTKMKNFEKDFELLTKNGWSILGAGGGGSMFFPTISPHNPDVMIVSCDMTDTYITYDGAKTWDMLNLGGRADAFEFDPVNEGVIYAGASSLYRSTDNGQKWDVVFPTPDTITGERFMEDECMHIYTTSIEYIPGGGRVQKILVDPKNPDIIYLAVSKGISLGFEGEEVMLWRTIDNCKTWQHVATPDGTIFRLVAFGNENPDDLNGKLYLVTNTASYIFDPSSLELTQQNLPEEFGAITYGSWGYNEKNKCSTFYIVGAMRFDSDNKMKSGVHRSDDLGKSWVELSGIDIEFHGPSETEKRKIRCINACSTNPEVAYISFTRINDFLLTDTPDMSYHGVIKTEDFGNTWDWSLKMGADHPDNLTIGWFEKSYDTDWVGAPLHMCVAPYHPEICFASGMGWLWLTMDGGKTWDQAYSDNYDDGTFYGKNNETTNCHQVIFDPFDKDVVIGAYTDNGMLKSTNGGKTWKHAINGVPFGWINTCYDMVFDPEVKGRAWGAWSRFHDYPRQKLFRPAVLAKKDETCKTKSAGGICLTEDCAENWTPGFVFPNRFVPTSIVLDPNSPVENRTLYLTNVLGGVWKSLDGGKSWKTMDSGIDSSDSHPFQIIIKPDGTLFLVNIRYVKDGEVIKGGVYKSVDSAESWIKVNIPDCIIFPNKITYDPSDPKVMYLTCWSETFADGEKFGGVYKTADDGETWSQIFDEKSHVFGVTVDPKVPGSVYVVTFEHAAFRSLDGGITWSKLDGYNFKWGQNPIMDPHDEDMIYITTFGGSMFHGPKAGCGYPAEDIIPPWRKK
jgi:photosystem II stability/assembly factor-like uncharacterized protein